MASSRPNDRLVGAGTLDLDRHRVVADGAGRQLDTVPGEDIGRDELGKGFERATAQLNHGARVDDPRSEPTRSAAVALSEPGHDHHLRRYTDRYAAIRLPGWRSVAVTGERCRHQPGIAALNCRFAERPSEQP